MTVISQVLSHKGVRLIGLGWTGFIAENLVMSHNRDWIIDKFGKQNYLNAYGTLSTVACGSIACGYFFYGRRKGPTFTRSHVSKVGAVVFQTLGLVGFSQLVPARIRPLQSDVQVEGGRFDDAPEGQCPLDFTPPDIPADGIYGLTRVSRHANFWSLGLLGVGTALGSPFITHVVMFTFPMVFAFIGGAHQDYRHRRNSGGTLDTEKDAVTSNVPFLALLTGKQEWSKLAEETKQGNAAVAVVIALGLALRRARFGF